MLIALSGGLAPLTLLTIPLYYYIYSIYYLKLTIALQSAVAGMTSLIYILTGLRDGFSGYDDALKAVEAYPGLKIPVIMVLTLQTLIGLYYFVGSHPLSKTVDYLKNQTKKPAV